MRIVLVMLGVIGLSAWGGYAVRKRDAVASVLLFGICALSTFGLAGAFFGWFGN